MRGQDSKQSSMMCLISPSSVVPKDHPLRAVKVLADAALRDLSRTFDAMYSVKGRPSIPPERLLKALLLMALYSVRSERMFCEQLAYNLLFRWFLDMDMTGGSFDATSFTKNRERLLKHDVAGEFFRAVVQQARTDGLMSREHFSVDGTLIDAWASLKSFRRNDDDDEPRGDDDGTKGSKSNRWVNFKGEKRTNETHSSRTDPEAKLMRKGFGQESRLRFAAHAIMENRNGLVVTMKVTEATGFAEREAALEMLDAIASKKRRVTLGADKGYDTKDFVAGCRARNVTPHVAMNSHKRRSSAIDGRTVNSRAYQVSQRIRRRIEEVWGWMKTAGNFRKSRWKGVARTQLTAYVVGSAYNLLRMAKLQAERG